MEKYLAWNGIMGISLIRRVVLLTRQRFTYTKYDVLGEIPYFKVQSQHEVV